MEMGIHFVRFYSELGRITLERLCTFMGLGTLQLNLGTNRIADGSFGVHIQIDCEKNKAYQNMDICNIGHQITKETIEDYLLYLKAVRGQSSDSRSVLVSALRFLLFSSAQFRYMTSTFWL